MPQQLFVDFNTMNQDIWSPQRRVLIGGGEARPRTDEGLRVLLTDDDLEVEATLEFDREHDAWWARPDWATRRYLQDTTVSTSDPRQVA